MISLEDRVHIDINNVAHWFYTKNDQEIYQINKDFPTVLCPWRSSSFEYRLPKIMNNNGYLTRLPFKETLTYKTDIFVHEMDNDGLKQDVGRTAIKNMADLIAGKELREEYSPGYQEQRNRTIAEVEGNDLQVRWIQYMAQTIGSNRGDLPLFLAYGYIEEGGSVVGGSFAMLPSGFAVEHVMRDPSGADLQTALFPTLFAVSLLHCKNVELIDMPITRQQRRYAERKNKPLIQYKTLVIEPFKKQVRHEAAEHGQSEIQRALHIARGHFRTYTEERPLFGKYSGTFWVPMHLRGNKSKGVVHKDYEVKAATPVPQEQP